MTRSARAAVVLLVATTPLAGCVATPGPMPTPAPSSASASPGRPPSASATPEVVDLTQPGAARRAVDAVMAAAGASRAIMVTVSADEASVSFVADGAARTWAYRSGTIGPVQSDINDVAQASFVPDDFALDDVGALFRAGRAVAGADTDQELQIVDSGAGSITMTVTTNPESRTVFFTPDGRLVPTLDFTSAAGLRVGYLDVVGARDSALQVGFGSDGVHLDTPGADPGTIARRQRSPRTPVIVTTRTEATSSAPFDPAVVDPAVVWGVVEGRRAAGAYSYDQPWVCVADDRAGTGTPRLYCTVAGEALVTDLAGERLPG